jgi:hypothetical protein
LVLVWFTEIRAWGHPTLFPLAMVLWAYLLSGLLLVEWGVLRALRRGVPALPVGPDSWSGKRATLVTLLGVAGVVTLLREGALAPTFVLDMSWSSTHTQSQRSATVTSSEMTLSGSPVRLAGRYVDCTGLLCGAGDLCGGFRARLHCDSDDAKRPRPGYGARALVSGTVSFPPDPFCYEPLYKKADVQFSGTITVGGSTLGASKSVFIDLNDSISEERTGLSSCYAFRRHMGAEAADLVADEINSALRNN